MTSEEIMSMPAGRSMDAAVAKAIGIQVGTDSDGETWALNYSTDIGDAWKVVEWLRKRGCYVILLGGRDAWHCHLAEKANCGASGKTACLAICRAALVETWRGD